MRGPHGFTPSATYPDEKKLSIADLSQTFPALLIEQVMPLSVRRRRKSASAPKKGFVKKSLDAVDGTAGAYGGFS